MNIFTHPEEALQLLDSFAAFDFVSMSSIICMMIDTASAKYHEDPVAIANTIHDAVQSINTELGAYRLPDERSANA